MDKKTLQQLEAAVTAADFSEQFLPVVSCIGVKSALMLCKTSGGCHQYVPLYDSVLKGAIKRAVIKEFDGSNYRQLGWKYGITETTIRDILSAERRNKNKKILEEYQTELFPEENTQGPEK